MNLREIAFGSAEYELELNLRRRVLRWPLGLDFTREHIEEERRDIHLGAFDGENLQAVLVLTPVDSERVKMRQVAVEPELQGAGLGRKLVEYSEVVAAERGYREMVLSARETAVQFYLHLGYEIVGEPFEEVTIPHREMAKNLRMANSES